MGKRKEHRAYRQRHRKFYGNRYTKKPEQAAGSNESSDVRTPSETATDMSDKNNSFDDSLWLGIDLGTTSVKAVLVNIEGDVIHSESCPTVAEVKSVIGTSRYEQDPLKILATVQNLVLPLLKEYIHSIRGVGITGQMHGVVMWRWGTNCIESLDQLGDVNCSNLYTWQDMRCTSEFLETLPRPSNPYQPLSTGHGCATMFWLVHNQPEFFKVHQFTCCGTIMDFLVAILCGLDHPMTSDQLAASLGYFNKNDLSWDSVLLKDNDFPNYLLPKLVPAGTVVGKLSSSLAGWPSGVPVLVAMGDVQCAMFATLRNSTDAAVNISTSIQLGFLIPAEATDTVQQESPPSISFFPYFDGHLLALCAGLNGGNAIHHFVDCLANWIMELGLSQQKDVPSLMCQLQKLAEESQEDVSSLRVCPAFFGERHDTKLRGHISGLSVTNFSNIGTIFRAVCEGIINHLQEMVSSKYLLARGITQLLVSGSVPVNNPLVKQRLIDLYTVSSALKVVVEDESTNAASSAVGAARVSKIYNMKSAT